MSVGSEAAGARGDQGTLGPPPALRPTSARPFLRSVVGLVLGLLLIGALGAWYLGRPAERLGVGGPRVGQAAPVFTLPNLAGERVALESFRGRPVVLNFWATWCVPCRKEMPDLDAAARAHRDRSLVVLAINVQEEPTRVVAFLDELGLRELRPLLDTNATVVASYRVVALPTTVFIDRQGAIRDLHVGQLDADALAQKLGPIL